MRDIEEMLTLDERSSADFILSLRKRWADTVYPAFINEYENSGEQVSTPEEGERKLKKMALYPWFSHLERIGQKMMWRLGSDVVFRCSDELLSQINSVPAVGKGSLKLDPNLSLPKWYTDTDIHMQPGSFHSNDLSGYVYQFGASIVMLRDNDGYKFHKLFATDLVKVCTQLGLTDAKWVAFDERADGLRPQGWPQRSDWHFPWCVLQATKVA